MIDARTRLLLEDMLINARLAQDFIRSVDVNAFEREVARVYAATRAVEIVGEAAAQVEATVRASIASLPWRDAIDMRNRLIHGYRMLEARIIFATIRDDFPALIAELERLLNERPKSDGA